MMKREHLDVLAENIRLHGDKAVFHRCVITVEEMAELTKEITKHLFDRGDMDHLTEEIADVYVVLQGLKMVFGIKEEDIDRIVDAKIRRQAERDKRLK